MVKNFINRAIFLDRDGVINNSIIIDGKPHAPKILDQFNFIDGVKHSLKIFKQKGYLNIIITNQPDVNANLLDKDILEKMHQKIFKELQIDDIFVCVHRADENCECRKPKPGLIYESVKKWKIDLRSSYLIGDRWRDIDLANFLCIENFFIDYNYNEKKPTNFTYKINNLENALKFID